MANEDIKDKYDVAIIGAGPAGIMAAGKASSLGLKVILIEKNSSLGKKLLLTGNSRCNLTNAEFNLKNLISNYNKGAEFLFHVFSVFGPKETIEFFSNLGLKTKIEKSNRVFPTSDSSKEVLETLKKYLENNKVNILYNSEIKKIVKNGKSIEKIILQDKEIRAKKYILTTGGKSYPLTGSNGAGYELAKKLGHTIVPLSPALAPIKLKNSWIKNLQGISLKNVAINILSNNKKYSGGQGEIMFTHSGISGPAIMNISDKVGELLEKSETKICLDFFPLLSQQEVLNNFEELLKKYPKKTIKNILAELLPEKFSEIMLYILGIDREKIANNMSKIEKQKITKVLKGFEVEVENVAGFEQAIVTKGGISLKEIDHKTMKSKIIDNLFFAGEIIDINGKTGGFNLQACWSTGYIAGQSCLKN
ncbi:MAG: NAD(P)/FAD-dependent oxidoreductase [Candidatus Staskawiczbacteria bacterium]|jgi:hypothetical protein